MFDETLPAAEDQDLDVENSQAPGAAGDDALDARDDYADGFSHGYAEGWEDAIERYESDEDDPLALTLSYADVALLGLGFVALAIPLGFLLARRGRA